MDKIKRQKMTYTQKEKEVIKRARALLEKANLHIESENENMPEQNGTIRWSIYPIEED